MNTGSVTPHPSESTVLDDAWNDYLRVLDFFRSNQRYSLFVTPEYNAILKLLQHGPSIPQNRTPAS